MNDEKYYHVFAGSDGDDSDPNGGMLAYQGYLPASAICDLVDKYEWGDIARTGKDGALSKVADWYTGLTQKHFYCYINDPELLPFKKAYPYPCL